MTSESGDRRPARTGGNGTKPTEPEQLPCPRCDSTNTKFCYYNNYNLSQPRHFCKACRRYWTRGGTLRNVPVGGGTRKSSSSHKRPRTTSPTASASTASDNNNYNNNNNNNTTSQEVLNSVPVSMISDMGRGSGPGLESELVSGPFMGCEVNLNEALPETGSFSSLLGNGFMSLHPGYGMPGLHGLGFGLGMLDWPMQPVGQSIGLSPAAAAAAGGGGGTGAGHVPGCNTWQMGGVEGSLADGDCFGWPDLAISTSGKRS